MKVHKLLLLFIIVNNSKFLISVIERTLNATPSWIQVDILNMSFNVTKNQYIKLGDYNILFQASLLSYSIKTKDQALYSTDLYSTTLTLINQNWIYIGYGIGPALIYNQMVNYTIHFEDTENDKVIVRLEHENSIKSFIQSESNSIFTIYLLSNEQSANKTVINMLYTDSFHPYENSTISFNVNLFLSNPPIFEESLSPLNISSWQDYSYNLPSAQDPDGDSFSISLGSSTPSWIYLRNSTEIFINFSSIENISGEVTVEIILTDSNSAWSNYTLPIFILNKSIPYFGLINDIRLYLVENYEAIVNITSSYPVTFIDWTTKAPVVWAMFNQSSNSLLIESSKIISKNKQCALAKSYDSWGNSYFSNAFNVMISFNNPPAVLTIKP